MLWELKDGQLADHNKTVLGGDNNSHTDWVRDVSWCSNIGILHEMIASCSEDTTCKVWKNNGPDKMNQWQATTITFQE